MLESMLPGPTFVAAFSRWLAVCASTGLLAACAGTIAASKPTESKPQPAPQLTAAEKEPSAGSEVASAPQPAPRAQPQTLSEPKAEASLTDESRFVDVMTDEGQRARGLYFNAPMARRLGARGVIAAVLGGGMNAAVIDIKDGEGRVSYDTQIPELQGHKHVFLKDVNGFVKELKDAGVYTIARVVCFSDPVLPKAEPDRSVIDARPGHEGEVWSKNSKRNTWLDPYNTKNHDTILALAKDVEAMGFDEIQFDYIRFPVDVATKWAIFPAAGDKPRGEVLLGMLSRIDAAIHIPIGVDVFGLTALTKGDSTGLLGQSLEAWSKHVEVISPMLYVNGMSEWMNHVTQGRAGLLVAQAVKQLRERVGAEPVIRPYLQAFERGADYYNPEFIAEQIRGSRDAGGDGFLFWHPASNYGMVRSGMLGPARRLFPFPLDERKALRERAWGKSTAPTTVATQPQPKPAS